MNGLFDRLRGLSEDERSAVLGVLLAEHPEALSAAIDTVISWREES